ncbi:hypothetical protein BAR24_16040 [Gluconobacter oxydans]|nr:hypothetical protein BAR24_16040 [Gluconobacter oxydans]KXV33561.1 hypothetical protein AD940_10565 [Gluconobacter thailandicus]KXV52240.1 hypothetical protein AD946_12860 [Gluconobacter thailandicus]
MSARLVLVLQVFNLQKKAVIHREFESRAAEKWSLDIISAWVGRMAMRHPVPTACALKRSFRFAWV